MGEVTVMMISSPDNPMNESIPSELSTTLPSWKLYENPFYNFQRQLHQHYQSNKLNLHNQHLPISTRKLAASYRDLTFCGPEMENELDIARTQIKDLKAELEYERKARRKADIINKRLAKELAEERRGRRALEKVCEQLAREISSDKMEIENIKKEMDEERKMLRMAEVFREERVQIKLAEAKILFEEKLLELELEGNKQRAFGKSKTWKMEQISQEDEDHKMLELGTNASSNLPGKLTKFCFTDDNSGIDLRESAKAALREKYPSLGDNFSGASSIAAHRRASPEPENPHIRRGIKGFVEFPRVIRAVGSRNRPWGAKLECQKAQLRILLKHKHPIGSNNLVMS
ncbi:hypothetical protein K2173_010407 [Erythroxylum novogranatense]|uniref:Branchless trichome n=1 Tax=Erythroxylum novogranatense TaxID=1862640 RepID=A0AAV8TDT5_9ROSI|nr:hypothetical protein K2173_010407 [Erythroxylum novogranatense]